MGTAKESLRQLFFAVEKCITQNKGNKMRLAEIERKLLYPKNAKKTLAKFLLILLEEEDDFLNSAPLQKYLNGVIKEHPVTFPTDQCGGLAQVIWENWHDPINLGRVVHRFMYSVNDNQEFLLDAFEKALTLQRNSLVIEGVFDTALHIRVKQVKPLLKRRFGKRYTVKGNGETYTVQHRFFILDENGEVKAVSHTVWLNDTDFVEVFNRADIERL